MDDCFLFECASVGVSTSKPAVNDIIGQNPEVMFGLAVALVTLAIGYVWYRRGLRPKALDYEVVVSTSMLVSESRPVRHDLAVSYKGAPVAEPKLIEVLVENTGREPVVRDDYDSPITVKVMNGSILEANVHSSDPAQAANSDDLVLGADGSLVELAPKLLNAKDRFVIQMIVDGFGARTSVSSRFTGQERSMRHRALDRREGPWWDSALLWTGVLAFIFLALFGPAPAEEVPGSTPTIAVVLLRIVIGAIGAFAAAVLVFALGHFARSLGAARQEGESSSV